MVQLRAELFPVTAREVHGEEPRRLRLTLEANPADGQRPVLMIGQPMDASGFTTMAAYLPDGTVITYDPRGLGRSTRDGRVDDTPTQQAEDVHALIQSLGAGPVEMCASSGGAVTAGAGRGSSA